MTLATFETLDISRRLKNAGFTDAQAETVTEIFRDVRTADIANLATKADLARIEARIDQLEAKFDVKFAQFEAKLEILRRDLTIRLGGMIIAATAILLAAKFFG
jgi:hypothetical protein